MNSFYGRKNAAWKRLTQKSKDDRSETWTGPEKNYAATKRVPKIKNPSLIKRLSLGRYKHRRPPPTRDPSQQHVIHHTKPQLLPTPTRYQHQHKHLNQHQHPHQHRLPTPTLPPCTHPTSTGSTPGGWKRRPGRERRRSPGKTHKKPTIIQSTN